MILDGIGMPQHRGSYISGFRTACPDAEIAGVTHYVTARFGAKPSHVTAADVKGLRAQ
ncbi:hypothetical protein HL653_16055 [Sphingomonas sp. AP4-R1]|uniref:hypothetical protein n=1 Tax=Sphingomonas sp. AP4-R1 TaxID=2735134 RepID=UPI001493B2EC|nr:hypothetical protein [Sphingomonas sp. AP4-R1]QJU59073.1 hypothetical protein HL653_16055 [Sphingomonas sp. AP4-R1]